MADSRRGPHARARAPRESSANRLQSLVVYATRRAGVQPAAVARRSRSSTRLTPDDLRACAARIAGLAARRARHAAAHRGQRVRAIARRVSARVRRHPRRPHRRRRRRPVRGPARRRRRPAARLRGPGAQSPAAPARGVPRSARPERRGRRAHRRVRTAAGGAAAHRRAASRRRRRATPTAAARWSSSELGVADGTFGEIVRLAGGRDADLRAGDGSCFRAISTRWSA